MSNMNTLFRELKNQVKVQKLERQHRMDEYQNSLEVGINFNLELYYVSGSPVLFREFPLEGYTNAMMLLEQYRKIGFNINLRRIVLTLNDKKVRGINFKK